MTTKKEIKELLLKEGITFREEHKFNTTLFLYKKLYSRNKKGYCFATYKTNIFRFYNTFLKSKAVNISVYIDDINKYIKKLQYADINKPKEYNRFIFDFSDYEDFINESHKEVL